MDFLKTLGLLFVGKLALDEQIKANERAILQDEIDELQRQYDETIIAHHELRKRHAEEIEEARLRSIEREKDWKEVELELHPDRHDQIEEELDPNRHDHLYINPNVLDDEEFEKNAEEIYSNFTKEQLEVCEEYKEIFERTDISVQEKWDLIETINENRYNTPKTGKVPKYFTHYFKWR